jgi:hypothetical protein
VVDRFDATAVGMESDRSPVIDPGAPSQQIYRIPVARVCKFCAADGAGSRSVASARIRAIGVSEAVRWSRRRIEVLVLSRRRHRFTLCCRGDGETWLASGAIQDGALCWHWRTRALLAAGSPYVRVIPFLRPYRTDADRATWFRDRETLTLIESELVRVSYRGIGEFHVFGEDAGSDVIGRVIDLAVARGLYLHAHCDELALERIFGRNAGARVIWAHTGFSTPPERIERWLDRFPALWGELSYRYDMTEDGHLKPEWRRLLLRHRDRFVIGSDTWINERWERYGEIMAWYRGWLAELPADVARAIAWTNAQGLFAR